MSSKDIEKCPQKYVNITIGREGHDAKICLSILIIRIMPTTSVQNITRKY